MGVRSSLGSGCAMVADVRSAADEAQLQSWQWPGENTKVLPPASLILSRHAALPLDSCPKLFSSNSGPVRVAPSCKQPSPICRGAR